MKNYRDQTPPICCFNCRHSFDVEYWDGCDLVCCESFRFTGEEMLNVYWVARSKGDVIDDEMAEMLSEARDELRYGACDRRVALDGVCDLYEKQRESK